ncbi:flagellin [Syntrophomonas palmitatica]|uniref:flagellin n=1 Tax=Syntrophomonas palmitatica TaxID=402877 RepID=UPI0006D0AF20|nr:flagellin [Syntrophomonas palmitatica]
MVEVTKVDQAPHFILQEGSNAGGGFFAIDKPLYYRSADGSLVPIGDNVDLTANFTYTSTGAGHLNGAVYSNDGKGNIRITFNTADPGPPPTPTAVTGDTLTWNNSGAMGKLYDEAGNEFIPGTATFDGTNWQYYGTSYVTANIKGHIYTPNGNHREINLMNYKINVEAGINAGPPDDREIFHINGADIDPAFTDNLVVWNGGTKALGGIDMRTPALQAGDKTVLSFGAAVPAVGNNAQRIEIDYNFKNIDGKLVGNGSHTFTFAPGTMDNRTRDIKFFTMDQETGVVQDGTMTFKTNTLGTANTPPNVAAKFDYEEGLFGFVEELAGTIDTGRLPQVGNKLVGIDSRLKELLYYRSTVGARINRLDLQENRLKYAEESLTDLLSKTEDADQAKVIMELKMQENVFNSSLAAGARIIQPTLMDFLR